LGLKIRHETHISSRRSPGGGGQGIELVREGECYKEEEVIV
jgi:hypothetical protein